MITVTPSAAQQILYSAKETGIDDAVLRVAIKKMADDSLHYAMGFDDAISDNDLRIDNLAVSGHHARVVKAGERFVLEDLGSTNGTWIGEQRVDVSTTLADASSSRACA